MSIKVEIDDHSEEVLDALKNAVERGLMVVGEKVTEYAQSNIHDVSGRLSGSIHPEMVSDNTVAIGTPVEYGMYVEFGTGRYAEMGGRKTPWVYCDESGRFWYTDGQKPKPFLRPAVNNHLGEYERLIKDSIEHA